VADLFPDIELLPVVEDQNVPAGHLLATLPVQLVVPEAPVPGADVAGDSSSWHGSAMRFSLVIAWCCLLLGSLAVAIMLRGVLLLSERRASFVSAVTHELRSPLTTFRMYAEMLAEGMVRDDAQRVRYLATLRAEAERLTHLVDNVLQYARLERSRKSRPRIALDFQTLVRQTTERLPQRALQSGMEWDERMDPQAASVVVLTDPAAVEQILFNLVDNACKYAAHATDRRIHLQCSVTDCVARLRVSDHGPGIEPTRVRKLFRAFGKSDQEAAQSAPGIGLGLALCRRLARDIGGRLSLDPASPQGAAFLLELPLAK
jgi:signal transduction histidine kinase